MDRGAAVPASRRPEGGISTYGALLALASFRPAASTAHARQLTAIDHDPFDSTCTNAGSSIGTVPL